jgi:hypothetical protein
MSSPSVQAGPTWRISHTREETRYADGARRDSTLFTSNSRDSHPQAWKDMTFQLKYLGLTQVSARQWTGHLKPHHRGNHLPHLESLSPSQFAPSQQRRGDAQSASRISVLTWTPIPSVSLVYMYSVTTVSRGGSQKIRHALCVAMTIAMIYKGEKNCSRCFWHEQVECWTANSQAN